MPSGAPYRREPGAAHVPQQAADPVRSALVAGHARGERALVVRRAPDHGRGPRMDHPGLRHVHAVLVFHRRSAPAHPAVAVRDDRPLRPAVSGALHRRDAARSRLRVLQQRAVAVRRVPVHHGDAHPAWIWAHLLARRGRGHAVFRLPEEAAGASLLACGERRGDGASARHGPLLHVAVEPGRHGGLRAGRAGARGHRRHRLGPRERVRAAAARGSAQASGHPCSRAALRGARAAWSPRTPTRRP